MTPRILIEPARLAGSSVMRCQTDERLVDLVRAGNDRAFEAIVDRYRRPLLRYCARLLPPARAEDAVQQAFLNAFAGLRRGDERIELRPWLYRVAHNASLNALRENGWTHERIEAAGGRPSGESAHEAAERRASLRTVLAAVQELPERQRDAMILRELEGRSYEQIAAELDASGGAVRQLLNRARHTLRAGATALTPAGILTRFPWGQSAPVVERMSDAAAQDGLRTGAARIGGALVASIAVAAGLSDGPKHLPRFDTGARPAPEASAPASIAPAAVSNGLLRAAPATPLIASVMPTRMRMEAGAPRRILRSHVPSPVTHVVRAAPKPPPSLPATVAPRAAPVPAAPAPAAQQDQQHGQRANVRARGGSGQGDSRSGDSRRSGGQAQAASHNGQGDGRRSDGSSGRGRHGGGGEQDHGPGGNGHGGGDGGHSGGGEGRGSSSGHGDSAGAQSQSVPRLGGEGGADPSPGAGDATGAGG
jgi:RNA polymerase sigma factor (sigma-70 family)